MRRRHTVEINTEELHRLIRGARWEARMRLAFRVFVVAMLTGLAASQCGCVLPPLRRMSRSVEQQQRDSVRIETSCGSVGSGVIVDGRHVLTASHVLTACSGAYTVSVLQTNHDFESDPDYPRLPPIKRTAELEVATVWDVARLRLVDGESSFVWRSPPPISAVNEGDHVCIMSGLRGDRRCGYVHATGSERAELRHTATTIKGDSGSGLYDDFGRLVGIVVDCDTLILPTGVPRVCLSFGGGATMLAPHSWLAGEP